MNNEIIKNSDNNNDSRNEIIRTLMINVMSIIIFEELDN